MLRKIRTFIIPAVMLAIFFIFIVMINRVTKTELVSRSGQTFEKAVVKEVLVDNLQADGSRVGQQTVTVRNADRCAEGRDTGGDEQFRLSVWRRLYTGYACHCHAERGR